MLVQPALLSMMRIPLAMVHLSLVSSTSIFIIVSLLASPPYDVSMMSKSICQKFLNFFTNRTKVMIQQKDSDNRNALSIYFYLIIPEKVNLFHLNIEEFSILVVCRHR